MQKSEMRLISRALEFCPKSDISRVPTNVRGIYVLYKRRGKASADAHHYDFVYIGMARHNIRGRLAAHLKHKPGLWSHFSCFEVWDNVSDEEIAELEGLFRHLYRFDSRANQLNRQKAYLPLRSVRIATEEAWLNPKKSS